MVIYTLGMNSYETPNSESPEQGDNASVMPSRDAVRSNLDRSLVRGIGFTLTGIASLLYGLSEKTLSSDPAGNAMGAGLVMLMMIPFLIYGFGALVVGPAYLLVYAYRRVTKK